MLLCWALRWGENFLKRESVCASGQGGNCKAALFKHGNHRTTLQGDRTVELDICQKKMIFHLAAWGGLFFPFPSLGGDEEPSCGLCTALETSLSNLGRALSFSFFFFFPCNPLSVEFLDTKQKVEKTLQSDCSVSTVPLNGCLWSFAVRSTEPCMHLLVNV